MAASRTTQIKESVVDFGALAPDLLAFFVHIMGKRW
jgi:hypothetical protein